MQRIRREARLGLTEVEGVGDAVLHVRGIRRQVDRLLRRGLEVRAEEQRTREVRRGPRLGEEGVVEDVDG